VYTVPTGGLPLKAVHASKVSTETASKRGLPGRPRFKPPLSSQYAREPLVCDAKGSEKTMCIKGK